MDSPVSLDVQIATWLHGSSTPAFTALMLVVSLLHAQAVVLLEALALAVAFHMRGERRWVHAVVLAIPGGLLVNVLVKELIRRPRPSFEFPLVTLQTYSFPSGHTAAATLLYGLIAAYGIAHTQRSAARKLIALAAAAMVALVAFSRMYLGAHYLSDVVTAAGLALLWLAIALRLAHARPAARLG